MVQTLVAQVAAGEAQRLGPWINTSTSSTPIYVVGPHQRTVPVWLSRPNFGPRARLQAAFKRVPIPPGAQPAAGADSELTVYQPTTGRLWEFFHAHMLADGWHADWGGAMRHVARNAGYFSASAWPGASAAWGASASSLPLIAGTMTIEELRRGRIEHALAIAVPQARAGVFAWPAQRSDGTGLSAADIPEGAHLRLNPALNISALHLPYLTQMIALAAQRYGIVVRDQTHKGIAFYAQDPTAAGPNPYYGPGGLYDGMNPAQLLASFPWGSLEVLKMQLGLTGN